MSWKKIQENLNKLDKSARDDRHINCIRFAKTECIRHKMAKCVSGILATEGVPIEDIADIMNRPITKEIFDIFITSLEHQKERFKTPDNQDFIQEARFSGSGNFGSRRIDHWQIILDKRLEFETKKNIKKEDAITVYI